MAFVQNPDNTNGKEMIGLRKKGILLEGVGPRGLCCPVKKGCSGLTGGQIMENN